MTYTARPLILLSLLFAATPGFALEVDRLDIDVADGRYSIDMAFRITASPPEVIALLTDFSYPDKLNPDVTSKEVVSESGGITRVRVGFRGCVLVFCKATSMTQDVRIQGSEITADAVADGGDFRSGRLRWNVRESEPGETAVRFRATIEHEKYVLPFIGTYFVRKRLKQQLLRTARNLEVEAAR